MTRTESFIIVRRKDQSIGKEFVKGYKLDVKNDNGYIISLFIHRTYSNNRLWTISELTTGLHVNSGNFRTRKEVLNNEITKARINHITPELLKHNKKVLKEKYNIYI